MIRPIVNVRGRMFGPAFQFDSSNFHDPQVTSGCCGVRGRRGAVRPLPIPIGRVDGTNRSCLKMFRHASEVLELLMKWKSIDKIPFGSYCYTVVDMKPK